MPADTRMSPVAEELIRRNHWLIRVRWLAVVGVVLVIEAARRLFTLGVPALELHASTAFIACYNTVLWMLSRRPPPRNADLTRWWRAPVANLLVPRTFQELGHEGALYHASVFAMLQISLDLVTLTWLLHLTGGAENPLLYFFIFHVIIASILLSRRANYVVATSAFLLIALTATGEYAGWFTHHHVAGLSDGELSGHAAFLVTRLAALAVMLFFTAYMCSTIAVNLREREREIVHLSADLARHAAEVEVAYRQVIENERAKSRYMRKVAHELQGPLGTIQTTLAVVLRGLAGEIPEATRELVSRARIRAEELGQVTRDLLTLSRAREATFTAAPGAVRLDEVCAEVARELGSPAEEAGLALHLAGVPSPGAPDAACRYALASPDPVGLRQLVHNLVSNAIRYTPRGGRVELGLSRDGMWLMLEVSDTGIGIGPEDLDRIFEEFYRSREAREFAPQGTGLGLAIVRAIANQHGGDITVTSEPGQGSTFRVTLPALAHPPVV